MEVNKLKRLNFNLFKGPFSCIKTLANPNVEGLQILQSDVKGMMLDLI